MKLKKISALSLLILLNVTTLFAQNISSDYIEFESLKAPVYNTEEAMRTYKINVTSPYNLTSEDVINQSKIDFDTELKNYDKKVLDSEKEFLQKLKNHETEVLKANEKFQLESQEFKKLSLLERLSMTDQGKNPKLTSPTKPTYVKPAKPIYQSPNLNDYIIVNNNVLETQIKIDGFTTLGENIKVFLNISEITFQDNAGQTFAKQPTKLKVDIKGVEKVSTAFYEEFKFVSSSPSNNINKPLTEKNFLNEVIATVNKYLNDTFGYQSYKSKVKILSVKNKGTYDELEKADIYISTNLRKLNPQNPEITEIAKKGLQKGIDIWTNTLAKVDYKNKKAVFNAKIGEFLYFNLIRLNLAMNNKKDAEMYLNEMQENMIYMKLSYDDDNDLKNIETQIYKSK
ncbi:hypothetical protein [uncultured Flavobacterium sp.]|uniref:hypothetical protein n=1 Tax=uncultured Flavobacterium sp. TaxID=165435 RepID=UPI0030CA472C